MMIGLEAPGPGNSVFQAMLALGDQAVGTDSVETPLPLGPRKRGQSSAINMECEIANIATARGSFRIIAVLLKGNVFSPSAVYQKSKSLVAFVSQSTLREIATKSTEGRSMLPAVPLKWHPLGGIPVLAGPVFVNLS